MHTTRDYDHARASDWAMQAIGRSDLERLVASMSDHQLGIFADLVSRMGVDAELSYSLAPQSQHAALAMAIAANEAQIEAAVATVSAEQQRRSASA